MNDWTSVGIANNVNYVFRADFPVGPVVSEYALDDAALSFEF